MKNFQITTLVALGAIAVSLSACSADQKTVEPERFSDLPDTVQPYAKDLAHICETVVPENYVYYESRRKSWEAGCAWNLDKMARAADKKDAFDVLEAQMDALYDAHAYLGVNSPRSPRLVPSDSDLSMVWDGGAARIQAIKSGLFPTGTGVEIDEALLMFNGETFPDAVGSRTYIPDPSAEQKLWALNALLAGKRGEDRTVLVRRDDEMALIALGEPTQRREDMPVTSQYLDPDVAYIRFNNSLGDDQTLGAFEAAVASFPDAQGWIIDLRDTPGGGNTSVAEPILNYFATEYIPYQLTVYPEQEPEPRYVFPLDNPIEEPVVVLVGPWTGSMGEGMAVGFDAMGATVMGLPMAGLAGGTEGFELPNTQITLWLPTYDLWHVDGTPRHEWEPPVRVLSDNGAGPDLALEAAIRYLGTGELPNDSEGPQ